MYQLRTTWPQEKSSPVIEMERQNVFYFSFLKAEMWTVCVCVREGFMVAAGIWTGDKATSLTRERRFN